VGRRGHIATITERRRGPTKKKKFVKRERRPGSFVKPKKKKIRIGPKEEKEYRIRSLATKRELSTGAGPRS